MLKTEESCFFVYFFFRHLLLAEYIILLDQLGEQEPKEKIDVLMIISFHFLFVLDMYIRVFMLSGVLVVWNGGKRVDFIR